MLGLEELFCHFRYYKARKYKKRTKDQEALYIFLMELRTPLGHPWQLLNYFLGDDSP